MRKKHYAVLSLLSMLLLTACSSEQGLDLNKKHIEEAGGKAYNIPDGAHISPYVDSKVISFYQSIGLKECKEGDVTWEADNAKDEILTAISKGKRSVYEKLAKEGRIGCASALK